MMKIKKPLITRIMSLLIAIVFLFAETGYSADRPLKLRPPLQFSNTEREATERMQNGKGKFSTLAGGDIEAIKLHGALVHLAPEQLFDKEDYFLQAVAYFNDKIIGSNRTDQIPPLTWDMVIDLYELFRGDRNNPAYSSEERHKRLESVSSYKMIIYFANTIFTQPEDVLRIAVAIFTGVVDDQIFAGWRPGFDTVLDSSRMGYNDTHPASGHHRIAWFMMNYFLIRNGYNPFYFISHDEYAKIRRLPCGIKNEFGDIELKWRVAEEELTRILKERVIDKRRAMQLPIAQAIQPPRPPDVSLAGSGTGSVKLPISRIGVIDSSTSSLTTLSANAPRSCL